MENGCKKNGAVGASLTAPKKKNGAGRPVSIAPLIFYILSKAIFIISFKERSLSSEVLSWFL